MSESITRPAGRPAGCLDPRCWVCRSSGPVTTWPDTSPRRHRGSPTATSWWSPARSCPRSRGGWSGADRPDGRATTRRRPGRGEAVRRAGEQGPHLITENRLGIVQAASGIDGSNVRTRRARPAARSIPMPVPAHCGRLGGAARSDGGGGGHRHHGPGVADRTDRRRHRRRRAAPWCTTTPDVGGRSGQRTATSPRSRSPTSWPPRAIW